MSNDLRLGGYMPALPSPGCCPNKVYALVFNHAKQALQKVGSLYVFLDYVAASIDSYDIPLVEQPQRLGFFSWDIPQAELTAVPETPPDEPFWVEYWLKSGTNPSQAVDTFQKAERIWWLDGKVSYSAISASELSLLSYDKAHVAVAYDTALGLLRFVGWAERMGQRITNPVSCEVKWLKRDGSTIAHFTLVNSMAGMPGVFQAEQAVADMDPDEATPIEIKITDAAGKVIDSNAGVASWD